MTIRELQTAVHEQAIKSGWWDEPPEFGVMKAITIFQPWASLLAVGAKHYETRGWATKYRGPIAIHAGMKNPLQDLYPVPFIRAVVQRFSESFDKTMRELPRGAVIATADLIGCYEIGCHAGGRTPAGGISIFDQTESELLFGDWTPGRYAWELTNMQMLPVPIPAKGRQGLWNLSAT